MEEEKNKIKNSIDEIFEIVGDSLDGDLKLIKFNFNDYLKLQEEAKIKEESKNKLDAFNDKMKSYFDKFNNPMLLESSDSNYQKFKGSLNKINEKIEPENKIKKFEDLIEFRSKIDEIYKDNDKDNDKDKEDDSVEKSKDEPKKKKKEGPKKKILKGFKFIRSEKGEKRYKSNIEFLRNIGMVLGGGVLLVSLAAGGLGGFVAGGIIAGGAFLSSKALTSEKVIGWLKGYRKNPEYSTYLKEKAEKENVNNEEEINDVLKNDIPVDSKSALYDIPVDNEDDKENNKEREDSSLNEKKEDLDLDVPWNENMGPITTDEKDKIKERYKADGFGVNLDGHFFNPWINEYDKDYNPYEDTSYNVLAGPLTKDEEGAILNHYMTEGFKENTYGHYFNPWTDEYDQNYNPINDWEYIKEVKRERLNKNINFDNNSKEAKDKDIDVEKNRKMSEQKLKIKNEKQQLKDVREEIKRRSEEEKKKNEQNQEFNYREIYGGRTNEDLVQQYNAAQALISYAQERLNNPNVSKEDKKETLNHLRNLQKEGNFIFDLAIKEWNGALKENNLENDKNSSERKK